MSVTCKIYDLASNELADISEIALEKTLHRELNKARSFVIQAPAGDSLLTDVAGDGFRNLRKGNRKLLVWEDGDVIFHGRIFTIERNGDGSRNRVTISAYDPWMELGYDSDDRAGRPVRDATGNFINPTFTPSGTNTPSTAISGPDLIFQAFENSIQTGDEDDPSPGEGPLPIAFDDVDFDLAVPPAVDLSVIDKMDWPILLGDFITQIVDTGVTDLELRPVDPSDGFDPYVMVQASAVSSFGTDRHSTVHFDYWTGSRNASACRHVEEFKTINNKLYDYLGPRIDQSHWRTNITPGTPGTTDLSAAIAASRSLYGGQFMQIREFDTLGDEASNLPLYLALWDAEQRYRLEPRDLLYITPAPGSAALFDAPADYDAGDLITIKTGAEFGLALNETQRVYGYDKTWSREGLARVSQLITSADPA